MAILNGKTAAITGDATGIGPGATKRSMDAPTAVLIGVTGGLGQALARLLAAQAILADIAKFQAAVAAMHSAGNVPLPQVRKEWTDAIALMDYVVPEGRFGIMRRNYNLQSKIIAELELIFQLKR